MTQKRLLIKSLRTLKFQRPLKFHCQTREYNTLTGGYASSFFISSDISLLILVVADICNCYNVDMKKR